MLFGKRLQRLFAKLTVDGAVSRNGGKGAVGVMCRNDQGKFMGLSSIPFKNITNPTVMDVLACQEVLALADDLMLHELFIALDSLEVIKDI